MIDNIAPDPSGTPAPHKKHPDSITALGGDDQCWRKG
jgi:hypothetical protein